MKNFILTIILSAFLTPLILAADLQLAHANSQPGIFDQLTYQDIVVVNLSFPVEKLLSNRKNEEVYKAKFSYLDAEGIEQIWNSEVQLRGRFRRTNCTEMPPLKLNFKKRDLRDAGLADFDDFKLVTECIEDDAKAKELLLKEFLAYKIYNEITDESYRVQFLKINFTDTETGKKFTQFAFIIEDTAQLRGRLDAEKSDKEFGILRAMLDTSQYKTMALFQYMIGNLDWDLFKKVHNVKVIEKGGKLLAIPYDFDFSGLVSAPYATLNPNIKVKSIKDRFYLGNPEDLEEMDETKALYLAKKDNILSLIKKSKTLGREQRLEIFNYINTFYKEIDDIQLPDYVPFSNAFVH